VGKLSERDLLEVDRRLRLAMELSQTALMDIIAKVDLKAQPADLVQSLAELSINTVKYFVTVSTKGVDVERLRRLLQD